MILQVAGMIILRKKTLFMPWTVLMISFFLKNTHMFQPFLLIPIWFRTPLFCQWLRGNLVVTCSLSSKPCHVVFFPKLRSPFLFWPHEHQNISAENSWLDNEQTYPFKMVHFQRGKRSTFSGGVLHGTGIKAKLRIPDLHLFKIPRPTQKVKGPFWEHLRFAM